MAFTINNENGIPICSVDEYMKEISILNGQKNDINAQLFFRGQGADYWNIKPSIFRDNMLSVEHHLMSEPLRQVPDEFKNLGDPFEMMEKFQHYGMCTRLLDVTTNPLVALYFACEHHAEEEYRDQDTKKIEKRRPQGRVYFKEESLPLMYDTLQVKVISQIASYDLTNDFPLRMVIQNLYEDGIINKEQKERWLDEKGILEFVNLCESVCTVLPVMNNSRLIRQSGAFLLPGRFSISSRGENIQAAILSKTECDLREEFANEFFYVEDENKDAIRVELEHCNISEANLFPELEYQLKYIRKLNESKRRTVEYFVKFQTMVQEKQEQKQNEITYNEDIVSGVLCDTGIDNTVANEIVSIFNQNQEVDWFKRDSVLSRIKILICKKLIDNNYNRDKAERLSSDIVKKVIEKHTKG